MRQLISVCNNAFWRNTGLLCFATQTYSNTTTNLLTYALGNFVFHTLHFFKFRILTFKIEACFMNCVWLCFTSCTLFVNVLTIYTYLRQRILQMEPVVLLTGWHVWVAGNRTFTVIQWSKHNINRTTEHNMANFLAHTMCTNCKRSPSVQAQYTNHCLCFIEYSKAYCLAIQRHFQYNLLFVNTGLLIH